MNTYLALRLIKFVAVFCVALGFGGAALAVDLRARKRAVHAIPSPALGAVWLAGAGLSWQLHVPLTQFWILAALLSSAAALMALIYGVARDRRAASILTATVSILVTLALMVFRPTWAALGVGL